MTMSMARYVQPCGNRFILGTSSSLRNRFARSAEPLPALLADQLDRTVRFVELWFGKDAIEAATAS